MKWEINTEALVKKGNSSLALLRKVSAFDPPIQDLKEIYILFVRSVLEQSSVVWHSGITVEQRQNLERVQKSALRIIMKNKYTTYKDALKYLGLETLEDRRRMLCLNFAKRCVENPKLKHMFPKVEKKYNTRNKETFKVNFAHTDRYKKSAIPYMQRLLNEIT